MKFQINESVVKVALIAFNFIFSILSVALIALGVVYGDDLVMPRRYVGLEFLELPTLLIVLGCLSFVASLVGCYCARNDSGRLMKLFIVFLSVLLAVELTISLISFFNLDNSVAEKTRGIIKSELFGPNKKDFHEVEKYYRCCGLDGAEDYLFMDVDPGSCCKNSDGFCTMEIINSYKVLPGCVDVVVDSIQQIALESAIYSTVFAVLQFLEIVCVFLRTASV